MVPLMRQLPASEPIPVQKVSACRTIPARDRGLAWRAVVVAALAVALACVGAGAEAPVAAARTATPSSLPQLLVAKPVAAPGDGPSRQDDGIAWRVTVSPDADGRRDVATATDCAPLKTKVQLRAYAWVRPLGWVNVWNGPSRSTGRKASKACTKLARHMAFETRATAIADASTPAAKAALRKAPLVLPRLGRATLGWGGELADGTRAPDGGYVVTTCRATGSVPPSPNHARLSSKRRDVTAARAWRTDLRSIDAGDEAVGRPGTAPGETDPTLLGDPRRSTNVHDRSAPATRAATARDTSKRASNHSPTHATLPTTAPDESPTFGEPARAVPEGKRGGCLALPVEVQVRRLAVAVESTGSVVAGTSAPVRIAGDSRRVHLTITRGTDRTPLTADVVARPGTIAQVPVPATLSPGLYRVAATDAAGNGRSAPLVVRSPAPVDAPAAGTALVVFPYLTWRAYNRSDSDRDGRPDTWYQDWSQRAVSLVGPYMQGPTTDVPPGAEGDEPHERAFMPWLTAVPRPVQAITDVELGRMSLAQLARYPEVVFPGHTEYYEPATWHLLDAYRNGGGNLLLLSSNNFFRAVRLNSGAATATRAVASDLGAAGGSMEMVEVLSRDTGDGRSDYRLAGVGFSCCVAAGGHAQYQVTADSMALAPWVFAGTGLRAGDMWGLAGVEVDEPEGDSDGDESPPGRIVLAEADIAPLGAAPPNATIALTQEGPGGGHSFATGNMRFVSLLSSEDGAAQAISRRLLENVWERLRGAGG